MYPSAPKQAGPALDDFAVRSFLEALATMDVCAARICKLKRGNILRGLAALDYDVEPQLAKMLNLMDDIQRSFTIIRRELGG